MGYMRMSGGEQPSDEEQEGHEWRHAVKGRLHGLIMGASYLLERKEGDVGPETREYLEQVVYELRELVPLVNRVRRLPPAEPPHPRPGSVG